jgi:hypothetical protein
MDGGWPPRILSKGNVSIGDKWVWNIDGLAMSPVVAVYFYWYMHM